MEAKRLRNRPFFAMFHFGAIELDKSGQIWTILDNSGQFMTILDNSGQKWTLLSDSDVAVVPAVPVPLKAGTVTGLLSCLVKSGTVTGLIARKEGAVAGTVTAINGY